MAWKWQAKKRNRIILTVVCFLITFFFFFPILWWFLCSLKPYGDIFHLPPIFIFKPTLTWYQVVLGGVFYQSTELAQTGAITGEGGGLYYSIPYLRDSTIIATVSTALVIAIASLAAYGLSRFNFRRRENLVFWILSTRMMPPIVAALPFYLMYLNIQNMFRSNPNMPTFLRNFQMIDTYHGIIILHTIMNLPLAILMLKSFFDDVPRELDEATLVDGGNRLHAFWIVLHYIRPGLAATAILSFIFSWNEFLLTLVLTKGGVRTMPVAASTFITAYGVEWGYLAALGSAAMVPVFIFILLVQQHLVRGLTLGAVKG